MMASGEEASLKIEKLNRDNYHVWKFQIKMYLIGKDLWDIVQGKEVLREGASPDESVKFRKREQLALSLICLSINNDLHVYVRSVNTAKDAWEVLEKHFEGKTLSKKIMYRRKLYSAKMEKGSNIVDHINYLRNLAEHLEAIGDPVSDDDLVIILLSSLPEEFDYLVTALETIANENLTWDYVRDRAINEFDKRHGTEVSSRSNPDALFTVQNKFNNPRRGNYRGNLRGRGNHVNNNRGNGNMNNYNYTNNMVNRTANGNSHSDSSKRNNFKCHFCGIKGHYSRNCFKKMKDKKPEELNLLEGHDDKYLNFTPELALVIEKPGSINSNLKFWWIDSGASQHMTPTMDEFLCFEKFSKPVEISLADNSKLYAYGTGDIPLRVFNGDNHYDILLEKVLYVPKIQKKLVSIPVIISKGVQVTFLNSKCVFVMKDKSYTVGHLHGKLYKLNTSNETCYLTDTSCDDKSDSDIKLWHLRYGHLGYSNLLTLSKNNMVSGLKLDPVTDDLTPCEGCLMGKQNRLPFPKKSQSKSSKPLDIIHSDVCGPIKVPSIGGSKYFITFIDDYTKYFTVYMMKHKDEALQKFIEFSNLVKNLFGYGIKKIRSDNGGEYINYKFDNFLKQCGIIRERTVPYSPQQNGVSERANRTLMESVRSLLHFAGLPKEFWAEALSTAVYLKNRSPTSCFKNETPYERWFGYKPDVSHLKTFGCVAYAHIPAEKRSKLDKKSVKCLFIGYSEESKGYKMYDPLKKNMFLSRDVIFNEKLFQDKISDKQWEPDDLFPDVWLEPIADTYNSDKISDDVINDFDVDDASSDVENIVEEDVQNNFRPVRQRRIPDRFGDLEYASIAVHDEPTKLSDALKGRNAKQWLNAIQTELSSLEENETWDLVDLPVGKNVVGNKWVFKIKYSENGDISRFKARLVAQGFTQEYGVDYFDVFAPVARQTSIRVILGIANQLKMDVHQMDVISAFLNGELQEEIFMLQPDGFEDPENPDKVCRLNKAIYGLKQSARCWNSVIDSYLIENNFSRSDADNCIYYRVTDAYVILICVYVDDTIIASDNPNVLKEEKDKLSARFKMVDQGEIHYLLGMGIIRNKNKCELLIDQNLYVENILKRFGMFDCRPVSTPLEPGKNFNISVDNDDDDFDKTRFQQAIGSLTYASICSRPDISASVNILSQYMSKPNHEHWIGIKRIMRYLKGTID